MLRALEAVGLIPKRRRTVKKSILELAPKTESEELENQEDVQEEALAEQVEANGEGEQAEAGSGREPNGSR